LIEYLVFYHLNQDWLLNDLNIGIERLLLMSIPLIYELLLLVGNLEFI